MKIDNTLSDTVYTNSGALQGTPSRPEDFLHMLDDFTTCVDDIKYVDHTSLYETVYRGKNSRMQEAAKDAIKWAVSNNMKLNASKTKELLIYFAKDSIQVPNIQVEGQAIERVHCAKLLGVNLTDKLDWDVHVNSANTTASKRLF